MTSDGPAAVRPDRLDSWKEIAAYLGKGVRTVQRWEATEGLPIRRLGQDKAGSVFAYKTELDEWWQRQSNRFSPLPIPEAADPAGPIPEKNGPAATVPGKAKILLAAGGVLIGLIAAALLVQAFRPTSTAVRRPLPLTTEHGWEFDPSFSPDGLRVAYTAAAPGSSSFIYVKTVGADTSTRLTKGNFPERGAAWSPDGRMIAFVRRTPMKSGASILLIPADGGAETRIADFDSGGKLVWSPDGEWLLMTERVGKQFMIVAFAVSTGQKHVLTEPSDFSHGGYGVSPDLRRLIFSQGGPGPSAVLEQTLGPGLKPLGKPQTLIPRIWLREMTLTAIATEIIYTDGTDEEGVGLWRCRLSPTAEPELIYGTTDRCARPSVSQNGQRAVFAVDRSIRYETWRLNLDDPSAGAAPLLSSTHSDQNPAYSPDGRYIAFHSTRSGASEIWVADRDGGNARRLTFTSARTTATPRWSPDGGWIAFESNQTGQSEVYLIRSNGGPVKQLTQNPAMDAIPNWSHDGRWIYFCSNRTGRYEVWKMPAFGGQAVQVTQGGGFAAAESPDGQYLYYSQTRNYGPLYRVALPEGQPKLVSPEISGLFYAVTSKGVYYRGSRSIWMWDAATKERREIFEPRRSKGFGIAVSPDGKELLFTQTHAEESDLYWIDGLR